MTISQSKQIQEGVNTLEKQGNHKPKYNNRSTKIKREHKHKIKGYYQAAKTETKRNKEEMESTGQHLK